MWVFKIFEVQKLILTFLIQKITYLEMSSYFLHEYNKNMKKSTLNQIIFFSQEGIYLSS